MSKLNSNLHLKDVKDFAAMLRQNAKPGADGKVSIAEIVSLIDH